jgi:hypothetical protein
VLTGTDPASQRRSLVRRGRRSAAVRLQGRPTAVNRRQSVRHGSEQRTAGQPSLAGSRGGGGTRVSPCRNAGQVRTVPPFAALRSLALAPLAKCGSKACVTSFEGSLARSLAPAALVHGTTACQPHSTAEALGALRAPRPSSTRPAPPPHRNRCCATRTTSKIQSAVAVYDGATVTCWPRSMACSNSSAIALPRETCTSPPRETVAVKRYSPSACTSTVSPA